MRPLLGVEPPTILIGKVVCVLSCKGEEGGVGGGGREGEEEEGGGGGGREGEEEEEGG